MLELLVCHVQGNLFDINSISDELEINVVKQTIMKLCKHPDDLEFIKPKGIFDLLNILRVDSWPEAVETIVMPWLEGNLMELMPEEIMIMVSILAKIE